MILQVICLCILNIFFAGEAHYADIHAVECALFKTFLDEEKSSEHLLFWLEAELFKSIEDPVQVFLSLFLCFFGYSFLILKDLIVFFFVFMVVKLKLRAKQIWDKY